MEQKQNKKQPIHRIRYGFLEAAIWENKRRELGTNTTNPTFHTVTLSRGYRSNGEIKNTGSFNRDNLLALAKLCEDAFNWIHSNRTAASE